MSIRALIRESRIAAWLVGVVCFCTFLPVGGADVHAQTPADGWSPPLLLAKIDDGESPVALPMVAADVAGGVQVFWRQGRWIRPGEPRSSGIAYARLDGGNWSRPIDVIAPWQRLSSAAVGPDGSIHLLWQGSGNLLYYSRASVATAGDANGWTRPATLGDGYANGQIMVDSRGRVHRVYPGVGSRGPYYQLSVDGGRSWLLPVSVSRVFNQGAGTDWVRMAVSQNGTVHIVWTEFKLPSGWPPLGVYYSRSEDGGNSWSSPVEIAGYGYDQINVAVGGDDVVHVAWNGMASIAGRYHRWSADGGQSWSGISTVLKGGGGTEGPPQLAVDGAGVLHLMTTSGGRVWYSRWQDQKWSEPAYVPSGDEAGIPPSGENVASRVRQIEQAAMTIGLGNRLHAVFWDSRRQRGVTYVWYTTRLTAAPGVQPASFPPAGSAAVAGHGVPLSAGSKPVASSRTLGLSPAGSLPSADPATVPPLPNPRSTALVGMWSGALVVGGLLIFTMVRRNSR